MRRRRAPRSPLAGIEPFARHPARLIDPLFRHAVRLTVRPGTVLACEGRQAREAFVVVDGEVTVTVGGRPAGSLGPATIVGVDEVVTGAPVARTLVAGTGLEVIAIPAPAVRWGAQTVPGLWDRPDARPAAPAAGPRLPAAGARQVATG